MKSNINYIFIFFGLFLFSCVEDNYEAIRDNELYTESYVYFAQTNAAAISEASYLTEAADGTSNADVDRAEEITILRTGNIDEAITVSFTVESEFTTTTDFQNAGNSADSAFIVAQEGSVEFAAGSPTAVIDIVAINDLESSGDKLISLTLTSAPEGYTIGFPGSEISGISHDVVIQDDDCPIDLATFEGDYTYEVVGNSTNESFAGDNLAGFGYPVTGPITLEADESDPLGVTAILTGDDIGGEYIIEFVTCPQEVVVIQPMTSFYGVTAWRMQQASVRGSYNDETKAITIVGLLGTNGPWDIVMEKVAEE